MLTTTPYLRIRRPSPTAVEFTISTLPPPTLALQLSLWTINILRSALSIWILLLLYAIWASPSPSSYSPPTSTSSQSSSSSSSHLLDPIRSLLNQTLERTLPGNLAMTTALNLNNLAPRYLLTTVLSAIIYALSLPLHTSESLLVLRGLGIQTSSSTSLPFLPPFLSSGWGSSGIGSGGGARRRFIPTQKIRDVLINEAFVGFGVVYCLVIIVEGESDVVVVFPRLRPRRDVVEQVWRGVRECLYEDGDGKGEESTRGNGVGRI
ncbi:GPI-GlcNAc transferase complex, PIG-H component-domain-containing protein [Xylariaceae sp. FL0255]|nr:GPI-GlcNAc transferase complex, PIG-H component-domain-containing protein [Xylariaceae sp. FL0255]